MGCTLTDMDIEHGKSIVRNYGWVVFEASHEKYFHNKKWLREVARIEIIHERNEIRITLKGGDWCTLENKGAN